MRDFTSNRIKEIKPSGIRKFFDIANKIEDCISLGVGEPDFDTPWHITEEGIYSLEQGRTFYTSNQGLPELREEISKWNKRKYGLDYGPEEIIVTCGGSEAIDIALRACINPGDEVIIPSPYWLSYPEMVKMADGIPVPVPTSFENEYKATVADFENAFTDKTKALILNTPSNPTGMLYTREELLDIADFAVSKDIYVVSDEMYEYLTYNGAEHVSIASLGDEIYKRTITVSGVAKSYAMTGWRIGYCGSPLDVAKAMSAIQSHATSNPNSIAQRATEEALLGPQDSLVEMRKEFDKRREYMYNRVVNMPHVTCHEPQGAFYVFVDAREATKLSYKGEVVGSAANIARILIEDYNTAVIPCEDFAADGHFRLSYAISMDMIEKGLDRIEEFLNSLA